QVERGKLVIVAECETCLPWHRAPALLGAGLGGCSDRLRRVSDRDGRAGAWRGGGCIFLLVRRSAGPPRPRRRGGRVTTENTGGPFLLLGPDAERQIANQETDEGEDCHQRQPNRTLDGGVPDQPDRRIDAVSPGKAERA